MVNRETYPYPEPRDEEEAYELDAQWDALERHYRDRAKRRERRGEALSNALDEAMVWLFFIILVFAAVALFAHYMRGR